MLKSIRPRGIAALTLCMLLCLCSVGAFAQGNLIANPQIDLSEGMAVGWSTDAWDPSRSVLEADESGVEGGCLHIINNMENDARFVQTIQVEPNTVYRLACLVRVQGATGTAGANISVGNSYALSAPVFDTDGGWVETEMYGVTGEGQTELTVWLRLGGYSATTAGEAWFDDVRVEKVEQVPEGAAVQQLGSFSMQAATVEDEAPDEEEAQRNSTALLSAVAVAFAAACAIVGLCSMRGSGREIGRTEEMQWHGSVLLFAALAVRLVTALFIRGFDTDINCFLSWSQRVFTVGPVGFYAPDVFCDYPPGYMYVLWLSGAMRALLGQMDSGSGAVLLIKLPNIAADIAACFMLHRFIGRRGMGRSALMCAALYALNPAVILDSAGWGQTDGLLSLLIVGTLVLAADKKWLRCMAVYALAVLVKPQALLFAPLGVMLLAADVIKSENKGKAALRAAGGIGLALVIWAGLSAPFAMNQVSEGFPDAPAILQPLLWLFEKYFSTLGSYSYYTVSACNIWDLLGLNWEDIEAGWAQWAGWGAYAAAFGFAAWMIAKNRRSGRVYLIGAAMLAIMFTFGLKMHERYLFPAILLLCFAANEDEDVRIPIAAVLISCAQLINMGLVLIYNWTLFAPRAIVVAADSIVIAACALLVWTCADLCLRERAISVTRIYKPSAKRLEIQEQQAKKAVGSGLFDERDYRMKMTKKEKIVIIAVTLLYSVFTFLNLGTLSAPQTSWTSAQGTGEPLVFNEGEENEVVFSGERVVFDLGEERKFALMYYGGICNSTFAVEFSFDGVDYTEPVIAKYNQGEIFRWLQLQEMRIDEKGEIVDAYGYMWNAARYMRLTAQESGLVLSEIAFMGEDGTPWPVVSVTSENQNDVLALIDEQDTVPERPSYYNSSYFDEIYHVRTAYEHIHGMHTYEWTHPPLGKLLIALGISIFGMNPFGWRFAGALAGVVMVPLMYMLVRQISRSKLAAFFGMMLMTLDCMHFTQTRIGTIDSFAVMFIMFMYLFMFRYARMSMYRDGLKKTLVPLALCGVSFALGCATKWICIYAGVGLAVLFFWTMARRYMEYRHAMGGMRAFAPKERRIAQQAVKNFWHDAIVTCLWCCVFFIAVPLVVYYFSYYWQLKPDGAFNVKAVVELQKTMLGYHGGLADDDHFFRSPWYEWPLIVKPMWYYSGTDFVQEGYISSISCMGNPAVWWGGLIGLIYVLVKWVRSGCRDRQSLVLLIGFASQYMPWVLVPRSTFIYHYFASVPFIIACAAMMIQDIERRNRALARQIAGVWIGAAAVLCAAFYPLMSGTPIPLAYAKYLRWFNWYNY